MNKASIHENGKIVANYWHHAIDLDQIISFKLIFD